MCKVQLLVSALLMVLLLVSCAPAAAPVPATLQPVAPVVAPTASKPAVPAAPAKPAWEMEWDKTVEAAKKEGMVAYGTSAGREVQIGLSKGFTDKLGIRSETIVSPVGTLASKILTERRAGLYLWDVLIGGAGGQTSIFKPGGGTVSLEPALILPELTDPEVIKKVWLEGKLPWVDKDRHLFGPLLYKLLGIAINTNLVKPGEIKSYDDLLDPKWKGKIVLAHPVTADKSAGSLMTMLYEVKGEDWVRKFVKQEPVIVVDDRLAHDWLAHGKYPIYTIPRDETFVEFVKAGAPIAIVETEDVQIYGSGPSAVSLIGKAAHPNAAKAFINFYLSREGQTIMSRAYRAPSGRLDVPTEGLPPFSLITPGHKKYWTKDTEEILPKINDYKLKSKELFGDLLK